MFFDCTALLAGLVASLISRWRPNNKYPYGLVMRLAFNVNYTLQYVNILPCYFYSVVVSYCSNGDGGRDRDVYYALCICLFLCHKFTVIFCLLV